VYESVGGIDRGEEGERRRTRIDGYGSCLGFENGRLREDRRREGMLGAGRDLCVSRKEEEEEDIVLHEREVAGHEILVMVGVVRYDPVSVHSFTL